MHHGGNKWRGYLGKVLVVDVDGKGKQMLDMPVELQNAGAAADVVIINGRCIKNRHSILLSNVRDHRWLPVARLVPA